MLCVNCWHMAWSSVLLGMEVILVGVCCCYHYQTSSSSQTQQQRAARRDVTNVGDDGVDLELAAAWSSTAPPLAIVRSEGLESARKTLSLSRTISRGKPFCLVVFSLSRVQTVLDPSCIIFDSFSMTANGRTILCQRRCETASLT